MQPQIYIYIYICMIYMYVAYIFIAFCCGRACRLVVSLCLCGNRFNVFLPIRQAALMTEVHCGTVSQRGKRTRAYLNNKLKYT